MMWDCESLLDFLDIGLLPLPHVIIPAQMFGDIGALALRVSVSGRRRSISETNRLCSCGGCLFRLGAL